MFVPGNFSFDNMGPLRSTKAFLVVVVLFFSTRLTISFNCFKWERLFHAEHSGIFFLCAESLTLCKT